jgi:hypothetical protein
MIILLSYAKKKSPAGGHSLAIHCVPIREDALKEKEKRPVGFPCSLAQRR